MKAFRKAMNIYCKARFAFAMLYAKLTGKRIPLMANLIITNRCNLRCFYCYVNKPGYKDIEPETASIMKLTDELYKKGTRLIVILGGEPLLHKGIDDIIRYVKNKKIACELITNGYFVDKHIDALSLCDSVCVSLDGNQEAHDHNRGKGSFEKAVNAIKLLRENGIPTRIKAVLTQNNFESLDFLCDFAKTNGLMLTVSTAAVYNDRDYSQKDKWLQEEEKKDFLEKLYELKKKKYPIGYSFSALAYMKKWPYGEDYIINKDKSNNTKNAELLKCCRKDKSLYVDADGYIYPCAYQWGKHSDKNVFTDGFDDAWKAFQEYDCYACGSVPDVDITLMLDCNIENIVKAAAFYLRW